jgi:hypothetical protein
MGGIASRKQLQIGYKTNTNEIGLNMKIVEAKRAA